MSQVDEVQNWMQMGLKFRESGVKFRSSEHMIAFREEF